MNKPSLPFLYICAVIFIAVTSSILITIITSPKEEAGGYSTTLYPAEDEVLLQNGKGTAGITTSGANEEYDSYDEVINGIKNGFFFPEYINEVFRSEDVERRYEQLKGFYLTETNVSLESPIATESNETDEYHLYKAASDYTQNISWSTVSLQYAPRGLRDYTKLFLLNRYDKAGSFEEYMKQYTDEKISATYYASSEVVKIETPLFDESYIIIYTYPNGGYTYNKFAGLKNLKTPINFLDFENNKTAITQKNLSGFINEYTEQIFMIDYFQDQNRHELPSDELQKMIDSISIK